jgi:capsular exopolysaccharide synthesis family protein
MGAGVPSPSADTNGGALVRQDNAASRLSSARRSELIATPTSGVNAISLLKALKKRWLLATCLGITLAAAVAAGVWFFLPPAKETAYAKLLVRDKVGEIFERPDARNESQLYLREQVVLLKSPLVLNAALNRPKVVEAKPSVVRDHLHPEDWLAQHVKVDSLEGPQILRLSLQLDDPEEAKVLLEAITDAYFEKIGNYEKNERGAFLKRLTDASIKHEHRLKEVRQSIKDLTNKNFGGINPQTAAISLELAMLDLREARDELRKIDRELKQLQFEEMMQGKQHGTATGSMLFASYFMSVQEGAGLGALPLLASLNASLGQEGARAVKVPEFLLDEYFNNNSKVAELRVQIAKSKATLQDARKKYVHPNDRVLLQLEDKLKSQQNVLELLIEELRPSAEHKYLSGIPQNVDPVQRQQRIAWLKQQKMDLGKEYEDLKTKASELNRDGLNLDDLRDDKDLEAKIANFLAEQREKHTLDLDAASRVSMLEPARIEHIEEVPRKLRFAGLGGLGALALTLLGVSFLEFRLHRVDSAESVVRTLGVNLVGTVPACPLRIERLASNDATAVYWQHVLTDSIDAARTMLVHRARGNGTSVVMISSAVSGEGKTSLACHLALSLVRAGYKTLLIDCDFRNPTLHRLFEQPLGPGFCELLRDECALAEVQRPCSVSGLTFMSAGQLDQAALGLLARTRGKDIFNKLRSKFEFIIVDSSPLLPVADGLLVAQLVDGALLSLLRDVSRLPRVYQACSRLTSLGVTVLGAVVNGTVDDVFDYNSRYVYTTKSQASENRNSTI